MGAHTYVRGIRDLDKTFNKMVKMKESCDKNGFSYPKEVEEYFEKALEGYDWENMDEDDLRKEMSSVELVTKGDVEYGDGLYINIADIPDDVKTINVYMLA